MENYFKLNKSLYGRVNLISVSAKYDKRAGGYVICCEVLADIQNGLISKVFCKEYYQHGGDGIDLIIEAGRKSAKKRAEAEKFAAENARKYAEKFLAIVKERLNIDGVYIVDKEE